jgi:hypothetical protein
MEPAGPLKGCMRFWNKGCKTGVDFEVAFFQPLYFLNIFYKIDGFN